MIVVMVGKDEEEEGRGGENALSQLRRMNGWGAVLHNSE